ncbi:hypothetical protein BH11PLA1_BH11PLA1_16620 [soil metagenome]
MSRRRYECFPALKKEKDTVLESRVAHESSSASMPDAAANVPTAPKESPKDTVISVIIAFIMAFVFRAFVVEAFVIPTGSMAPTLMGAHMRFDSPQTGFDWAVNPWEYDDPVNPATRQITGNNYPRAIQGASTNGIDVTDPMTGQNLHQDRVPRRAGDRILVLKYLFGLRSPRRFDVVVFKDPKNPSQNFIKRLVGLPQEQIALVDGDVFARPASTLTPGQEWGAPGWAIQRKPRDVQRAVWQPVYDTAYTPADAALAGPRNMPFARPFVGDDWTAGPRGQYTLDKAKPAGAALRYDTSAVYMANHYLTSTHLDRTIIDRYPYNEIRGMGRNWGEYPVSDVRLRAGVEPTAPVTDAFEFTMNIAARGHEFRALIKGQTASVQMRRAAGAVEGAPGYPTAAPGAWTTLATGTIKLTPGRATPLELWHYDQSLDLIVDGEVIAAGTYDWTPLERVQFATGRSLATLIAQRENGNALADPGLYQAPVIDLACNQPVTLRRISIDRDIFYQPSQNSAGNLIQSAALAAQPARTLTTLADQYFCLGDNSPNSSDGRYWGEPEAWVRRLMGERGMDEFHREGVVPGDLLLGKAFFVYFPAPAGEGASWWIPDFGRLRFIR